DALPALREGWLRLVLGGPASKLTYTLTPASAQVTTDLDHPSATVLQLSIYNGSGGDLACKRITLAVPIGGEDDPVALTACPALLAVQLLDDSWTASNDQRGTLTLEPAASGAVLAAGRTLGVQIAGVRINSAAGPVAITISEDTDELRATSVTFIKVADPARRGGLG